ncbi:hypothetical protein [Microbulbifer aggregans]|uniref:hypothetical protein n=1 Tax=Microbulbifer aggregans TaxID=1769779 RepID=UPI001CFCF75D|nr:hypothetical protein [Microbulbifer aggregans]
MGFRVIAPLFLAAILGGCAQVPKEAVELSATVGRDIAEMKKSHVALVDLYYSELISDINKFIDTVYLPYQIQQTLADDFWKSELLTAIDSASKPDTSGVTQRDSLAKIEAFLQITQEEVESYRKLKLKPIQDQHAAMLASINQSYEQIHYANSIVTGHLASVVKVHDTQNQILEKVDLKDLRTEVGSELSGASDTIGQLIEKAKSGEDDLERIISIFNDILRPQSIDQPK